MSESGEERPQQLSWRAIRFELMWTQHGGSGLGMSAQDVGELDLDDIFWLLDALIERRRKEAQAMKPKTAAR